MSETKIENKILRLEKGVDTLSGAMYANAGILKSPIEKLVIGLDTSSKKTQTLTKWLIFWTGVMAFVVIGQIIAIILTQT